MSICLLPHNILMTHTIIREILIGSLYCISYETAFLCEEGKVRVLGSEGGEIRLKERVSGRVWRLGRGHVGQRGIGLRSGFWN
jgi:hypothetical protein